MMKRTVWVLLILMILLVGCKSPELDVDQDGFAFNIEQVKIENYLAANIIEYILWGEVFCGYEPLTAEQGVDGEIYLWVICTEYYMEYYNLKIGLGRSLPVVLQIEEKNGSYVIVDHVVPRSGTYYPPDIYEKFPESTWPQIFSDDDEFNERRRELSQDLERRAIISFMD